MSDAGTVVEETEVGSYFVANYPPFSVWTQDAVGRDALPALDSPRRTRRPARPLPPHPVLPEALPLLLLPRLHRQERARGRPATSTRSSASGSSTRGSRRSPGAPLDFVYFGGGTPSFLSTAQLERLVARADRGHALDGGRGDHVRVRAGHAHRRASSTAIRELGVTRLSLGVENFDDRILELNGRAHRSPEIFEAWPARAGARLPADQHRPDRGDARRDRRQLAATASRRRWRSSPTA